MIFLNSKMDKTMFDLFISADTMKIRLNAETYIKVYRDIFVKFITRISFLDCIICKTNRMR